MNNRNIELKPYPIITVKKIHHRGDWQIGLYFEYHPGLIDKIRALPQRQFSQTRRCWYIPYTSQDFNNLKNSNLVYKIEDDSNGARHTASKSENAVIKLETCTSEIDANDIETVEVVEKVIEKVVLKEEIMEINSHDIISSKEVSKNEVKKLVISSESQKDSRNGYADINVSLNKGERSLKEITFNSDALIIHVAYNKLDVAFLKNLHRSFWSKKEKRWRCKATLHNLESLQKRFAYWNKVSFEKLKELIAAKNRRKRAILRMSAKASNYMTIEFVNYPAGATWIKNESDRKYDSKKKQWKLPYSKVVKKRIIERLVKDDFEVYDFTVEKYKDIEYTRDWQKRRSYLMEKIPTLHQAVIGKYIDNLIMERYSWSTIKGYVAVMTRFFYYLEERKISDIDTDVVRNYIQSLSNSQAGYQTINKHHSGIKKFCLETAYIDGIEFDKIPRPRRPKTLPKIISKQEIKKMFATLSNIKHLSMLYITYGAGLRSGEVISMKVHDLDWERNQIWIRKAKGNKDRVVNMPQSVRNILQVYIREYKPKIWLFEGAKKGTPYSKSSLRNIFKRSLKKAGITQNFNLHCLRHSFATHLLDSGTDVRLIKELLGHSKIETTLIYTHISNQTIAQIVSPLDTLGLQKGTK